MFTHTNIHTARSSLRSGQARTHTPHKTVGNLETQTQLLTITVCQKLRLRFQGCGLFAQTPYRHAHARTRDVDIYVNLESRFLFSNVTSRFKMLEYSTKNNESTNVRGAGKSSLTNGRTNRRGVVAGDATLLRDGDRPCVVLGLSLM